MKIIISNSSKEPIYEQVSSQIKGMILKGELEEGELLPSIRGLARDLKYQLSPLKGPMMN